MSGSFTIELLSAKHDRGSFSCGVEPLDRYLRTQASQDARRRVSNCFVAVQEDDVSVAGYYTLAASSIPLTELPADLVSRLPNYAVIPAALVGRLAVDSHHAGKALGSALLYDALARAMNAEPAIFALVVDAKDERAAGFYRRFGFLPFTSRPLSFFLPIATAVKMTR
ncbi:GNAT family N-acetyltransferase [Dongia sp.]|uniref:GNAT family N-acetyltransferase n=1 Tax=Dongia sp. TaxID=1977262 RepID=UPI0037513FE1